MAQRTPRNNSDAQSRSASGDSIYYEQERQRSIGNREYYAGRSAGGNDYARRISDSRRQGGNHASRQSGGYRADGSSSSRQSRYYRYDAQDDYRYDEEYEELTDPIPVNRSRRPQKPPKRRKKGKGGVIAFLVVVLVLLCAAGIFAWKSGLLGKSQQVAEVIKPLPAAPAVVRSATIGATGDILLHGPILEAHATWDGYDFSPIFENVSNVYQENDLMIANLEVTLGGPESGEYTSYPAFNSPDEIVPALKNAGVDLCLTANNHSNDTGYYGMMRTLDVLDDYGVEHLGSRETTDEHYLSVKNINGIRIGMLCYTYDTREYTEGEKSLNFNYLSDEAVQKIATFNYEYLDEFYDDLEQQLYYMDMLHVDAKVVFLHWGTEYEDYPNDYQQTNIAQRLCDMGVDVIIGGHPHVIQEFDVLESSNGHQMVCLYSMGNQLSNQRRELMDPEEPRGYTEDGLVMQVTFEKFNNGNTKVGAVNIVPTWVQVDGNGYKIIALDGSDPWSWGSTDTYSAMESYNRTIERLGSAYINYRAQKHQSEIVEYIS